MELPLPNFVETLIVGAGFSGICLAIKFLQSHRTAFLLIDRSHDIGGTWNFNRYPGCACDIPSHLYSFSFELYPDWSSMYAGRSEILQYLKYCAQKYRILPHVRLKTEMLEAFWDESTRMWRILVLCDGTESTIHARFLVSAVGGLHLPNYPEIKGIDRFAGSSFHSSTWDPSHVELDGKVVAVIGTGASAIQIVPEIAKVARKLYVYQRTPAWIFPKAQSKISLWWRKLFRRAPVVMRLFYYYLYWVHEILVLVFLGLKFLRRLGEAQALKHMEKTVEDPELRAALAPKYELGCKRVLLSNNFYKAIVKSSVELVTGSIKELREKSIVSCCGEGEEKEAEVDVIVYATGFKVVDVSKRIVGRNGLEFHKAGLAAMLGVTKAGFPNFFMLCGPNSALGHTSQILMIEAQVRYIMSCMRLLQGPLSPALSLELRAESQDRFQDLLKRRFPGTVWHSGKCTSWYQDPQTGHILAIWPGSTLEYWYRTLFAVPSDYHLD